MNLFPLERHLRDNILVLKHNWPVVLGWSSIMALLFLIPWTIQAQDASPQPKPENSPPKESGNSVIYGKEIYVPETPARTEPERAARSFSDGFLRNSRQHIGFSVGVSETYTPNVLGYSLSSTSPSIFSGNKAVSLTSIFPQLYMNFQNKRFDFRLNYGVTYNRYNGALSQLNRPSQNGSATLSYTRVRRKMTVRLSENIFSRYYDLGSSLGASMAIPYQFSAPQLYLEQRRETVNLASASVSYNVTKRSSISATLDDEIVRYSGTDIPRTSGLTAGIGASYQIQKWFYFDIRYFHYLNNVDPRVRNNNIENLQIVGFSLKPKGGWVIAGSGSVQSTKTGGTRFITGGAQGSVSKTSARTTIGLTYNRGLSTVFPSSDIYSGDTAQMYFVQFLSRRVSFHGNASYIRASALVRDAIVRTAYGTAGLDVAFQKNLVFFSNYSLVSQNLANISLSGTNLHRSTVTVGINYFLPSLHNERIR